MSPAPITAGAITAGVAATTDRHSGHVGEQATELGLDRDAVENAYHSLGTLSAEGVATVGATEGWHAFLLGLLVGIRAARHADESDR